MQDQVLSAVVFDLDGTLCYYTVSIKRAMADTLRQAQVPADLIGDLCLASDRYGDLWYELQKDHENTTSLRERIWIRLLAEHNVDNKALAHRLSNVYVGLRTASLALFDGVLPLLTDLHARYTLGLLTNGPSHLQWEKINLLGLKGYFDAIIVSGDMGIHKPDPRLFAKLLELMSAPASGAVYVGNSYEMDIIGASDAGMLSIWVNPDGEEEPQAGIADGIIANVTELREILL